MSTSPTRRDWEIVIGDEAAGFVIALWPEAGPTGLGERLVVIRGSHEGVMLETNLNLPRGTMDDARERATGIASAAFGQPVSLKAV